VIVVQTDGVSTPCFAKSQPAKHPREIIDAQSIPCKRYLDNICWRIVDLNSLEQNHNMAQVRKYAALPDLVNK
jgi:hypothetical protein